LYLVGWEIRQEGAEVASGTSTADRHEPATKDSESVGRGCRPVWERAAPPAAALEQPFQVLASGHKERLAIHAPELS
jgi:hypothetical protein